MSDMDDTPDDQPSPGSEDEVPAIEDAYEAEAIAEAAPPEDDPAMLDTAARRLDGDNGEAAGMVSSEDPAVHLRSEEDVSDAAGIDEDPLRSLDEGARTDEERLSPIRTLELASHRIGVELKRIESRVRELLEGRDSKRKRRLSGTARWLELQEDVLALRYSGRVDETALAEVSQLIARRQYLFTQLRFLSSTRPAWNT